MSTTAPGLFACKKMFFEKPFSGGQEIKVFASKSHALKRQTHGNGAAIWVESANKNEFTICVLEYGDGSNGTAELNWIALQSEPVGSKLGTTSLNPWNTETHCKRIAFQKVRGLINLLLSKCFSCILLQIDNNSVKNLLLYFCSGGFVDSKL